jgi:glucan phosphorylase
VKIKAPFKQSCWVEMDLLYETLEKVIPLYYQTYKDGKVNVESPWIDKMIHCVAQSAFFNTDRMVREYQSKMWERNREAVS